MNFKFLTSIALLVLGVASQAVIASSYEGKINSLLVGQTYGSKVFVSVDGDLNQQGCHTNPNYNYVFDASTESGKITLSVVLSAYATKNIVSIAGTENCSIYGGVENLQYVLSK